MRTFLRIIFTNELIAPGLYIDPEHRRHAVPAFSGISSLVFRHLCSSSRARSEPVLPAYGV